MSRQPNGKLDEPLSATAIIDHQIWEDAKSRDLVRPPPFRKWRHNMASELDNKVVTCCQN